MTTEEMKTGSKPSIVSHSQKGEYAKEAESALDMIQRKTPSTSASTSSSTSDGSTLRKTGRLNTTNYCAFESESERRFIGYDPIIIEDIVSKLNELETRLEKIENGNNKDPQNDVEQAQRRKNVIRVR